MKYKDGKVPYQTIQDLMTTLGLNPNITTSVTITHNLITVHQYVGQSGRQELYAIEVFDPEDDEYEEMTNEEFDRRLAEGEPVELRVESRPSSVTEENQGQASRPVRDDQGHGGQGKEGSAGDERPRRR